MPDQPASHGSNNPRNNPRQHKKPTRRHPGAPAPTPAPLPMGPRRRSRSRRPPRRGIRSSRHRRRRPSSRSRLCPASSRPLPAQPQDPRLHEAQPYQPHDYQPPQPQPQPHQASSPHGYAGYAAQVPPRVVPATKTDGQVAPYADMGRYKKKGKKKASVVSIIVSVVILAAIGVGVYLYLNPLQFNVTVNGMTRTVDRGTTLSDMIAEGVVSPKPGNLLAVDGEVLEEGGGAAFAGTVNGNEVTDGATELHKGDVVQLDDGADATEDYDVTTEEAPPGPGGAGRGGHPRVRARRAGPGGDAHGQGIGQIRAETVNEGSDNVY